VFFRAKDPKGLAQWYEERLGIKRTPESYDEEPWAQDAGPTVFAPFPADTDYFGDDSRQFMVNFRVDDLDALARELEEAGVSVHVHDEVFPNGRFAHLDDPEGNRIELWEPA
jgi:predicted enzyme related to lactoylglutathione lyase